MEFSKSLAWLRKRKKVSQRAAAQQLGVSQSLLSHYENGLREPGIDFLRRASKYYDCSLDSLLGHARLPGDEEKSKAMEALIRTAAAVYAAIPGVADGTAPQELLDSLYIALYRQYLLFRGEDIAAAAAEGWSHMTEYAARKVMTELAVPPALPEAEAAAEKLLAAFRQTKTAE